MCTALPVVSPTLVTSATIALLKPSLWYFCLCGTSWGAEGCGKVCYGHHLFRIYHLVKLFFPSNASWLSPGHSTRSVACCLETVN